jgi:hypothetical protein
MIEVNVDMLKKCFASAVELAGRDPVMVRAGFDLATGVPDQVSFVGALAPLRLGADRG